MNPVTSPERWVRIKNVFAEAAELPASQRAAWLSETCGTDEALRAEVERLLIADAHAEAFLEATPMQQFKRDVLAEGETIGAYRILRELGRGGMGTVYLAERSSAGFEQKVAIKVIKRGMDSDEVLRRFYAERQILAQLNHPNIARLLDGGQTADGRPFYVMEYIEGDPLDEFCKKNATPLAERLSLFQDACAAVQYAHQNLVIHRDLKPSNIMVTPDGAVKLLDFGIAKVLSPNDEAAAAETLTQLVMLTPAYASPEQMRGARLTTASDVYSLGVILYELLTEASPYEVSPQATQAFTKAVCETEPLRPSLRLLRKSKDRTPSSAIDSELDYIVMMALRKEAARRYASVEQFNEDIRRYLNGQPVSARPDTFRYRASKFVRRNRALTAATLAVALSLTGGIALTWRQARIAERERALAQRRFDDVRQLANAFVFKYNDEVAKLQGSTALREMMVNDAKDYLTRLAQDAEGDISLQLELAQAWMKIGDVLGKPYLSNLGNTADALKSYEQARALAEAITRRAPQHTEARRVHGLALQSIGFVETRAGNTAKALPLLEQAINLLQPLTDNQADTNTRRTMAQTYAAFGDSLMRSQDTPDRAAKAVAAYQQALQLNEALFKENPQDLRRQRAIAILEQRLGTTALQLATNKTAGQSTMSEALAHHARSTNLFEQFAAKNANDASAQRDLYDQYQMQAEVMAKAGEIQPALELCRKAIAYFEKAAIADVQNVEAQRDLATAHYIACTVYQAARRSPEAATEIRQALAIYERMALRDPRNAENYSDLLSGYGRLADAEKAMGNLAQSEIARQRSSEYKAKLEALR